MKILYKYLHIVDTGFTDYMNLTYFVQILAHIVLTYFCVSVPTKINSSQYSRIMEIMELRVHLFRR